MENRIYNRIAVLLLFTISLLFCLPARTQYLKYPIVGTYKGKTAQGMAINGNYAYLMSSGGLCRKYDLATKKVVKEFLLASAGPKNHVNSACFGVADKFTGGMPLLYISECNGICRCFVEDISGNKPQLLQTISSRAKGHPQGVVSWVVDKKGKNIYAVIRGNKPVDDIGNVKNTIVKYRLPELSEGAEVCLTEKDELDRFDVQFANIIQGCKIENQYLYVSSGLQESVSERKDAKRAVIIIDLKKRMLKKIVDLTYVTTNEPEDIDKYDGKWLMYCGQEGGLYQIKL